MTQVHWATAVSGDFTTAADWTGGVAPGAADTAILDAAGNKTYTVTADTNQTVNAIQLASTASLIITGRNVQFTASNGTGGGADAGTVGVLMLSTLEVGGVFDTSGGLGLVIGSQSILAIEPGGLTLAGTGGMHLAGGIVASASFSSAPLLTNESVIVSFSQFGQKQVGLGNGFMTLDNTASGVIETGQGGMLIDTGAVTIVNAGLIASGQIMTIVSPVNNTGRLTTVGGTMFVRGAVTGSGVGIVDGGVLDFASTFEENVIFRPGAGGVLELGEGQAYTGKVTGLSTRGANGFVLNDVGFISGTTKASFSGTTTSGVLTVTDGAHTDHINLIGDYVGITFVVSGVPNGTVVHAAQPSPSREAAAASASHGFVAAMAAFASTPGAHLVPAAADHRPPTLLAMPKFGQSA